MQTTTRVLIISCLLLLGACDPQDRLPGLWLTGEEVTALPEDWSFSDQHQEIFVQVGTPYLLPHSVTVWCSSVDGTLYLAARDPDSKNWPGWVEDSPDVKIKIADKVYPVTLVTLEDAAEIAGVQQAYIAKYELPATGGEFAQRYWRVAPRG